MSVHHISGTQQMTIIGPAKVTLQGADDAPIVATLPVPTFTNMAPATAVHDTTDVISTMTGTNFTPASDVLVNGVPVSSTYVSATSMTAQIPVKGTAAGTVAVTIRSGSNVTAPRTFTYS